MSQRPAEVKQELRNNIPESRSPPTISECNNIESEDVSPSHSETFGALAAKGQNRQNLNNPAFQNKSLEEKTLAIQNEFE